MIKRLIVGVLCAVAALAAILVLIVMFVLVDVFTDLQCKGKELKTSALWLECIKSRGIQADFEGACSYLDLLARERPQDAEIPGFVTVCNRAGAACRQLALDLGKHAPAGLTCVP
jgi:hypothetical protein